MATTGRTTGQSTTSSLASDVNRMVRDTAYSQIENQKQRATDLLGDVARAVRNTTQQMSGEGGSNPIASYANSAADRIDEWSETLRTRDFQDLARDVRQFARQQPALFLGTAFGLGLLAARFLKSSGERMHEDDRAAREQMSSTWTAASAGGAGSRPYVAHDTPDTGIARPLGDLDLDVER